MTEDNTNSTKLTQPAGTINVNTLGYFLDGWSDLIEGMGEKAGEVRENLLNQLETREMPNIDTKYMNASINLSSKYRRAYAINSTNPGATTTIYIAKHGKDLYASWRTFIKPVLNWNTLGILILASVMLGIFFGGLNLRGGFSFTGWITSIIIFFILGAIVIGIFSRLIRGNFMAFFFIEPNIFDAEDITAMSLSTHKSIMRALDSTGIDITKLRLKRDFKGGRLGETV